jgi:hypothetical protein
MAFENLMAPRASLNISLDQTAGVLAKLSANGTPGVLVCENIGGMGTGSFLIPISATETGLGGVPWLDATQNLTDLGVPTALPIYLQIWVAAKKSFYDAAGVIADLNRGETVNEALE